jgi:SAM-dependent methyltransferase
VADEDRTRWDPKHQDEESRAPAQPALPAVFAPHADLFPTSGQALDLACGRGEAAVWLAQRGLHVWGLDVSPVAVDLARALAVASTAPDRCRFDVVDLDEGLPAGPPVDVIHCHLFRDPRLDTAVVERLAPGGVLAIAVLSEVGYGRGPFRARPGELPAAFGQLSVLAEGQAAGIAWLLGRRRRDFNPTPASPKPADDLR